MDLGTYLKIGRLKAGFSIPQTAYYTGCSAGDVVAWERNDGRALPLSILKQLISLYHLDAQTVFDLLLQYQLGRIQKKWVQLAELEVPCD
jgi:hypothetical protein